MEEKSQTQFCRLCLSTSAFYYSLLKNDGREMLQSLTGITVEEHPYSCIKCWMDLKSAYQIQQRFVQSDKQCHLWGLITGDRCVQALLKIEQNMEECEDNMNEELIFIETESQVDCDICGVKCDNEGELYEHTTAHYNEGQSCDTCQIKLPDMVQHQNHIEANHPEQLEKSYCCDVCPLSFTYQSLYNLHLTRVHPRKNKPTSCQSNLKCEECNKVCRTVHSYKSHVKGHIRKSCPVCGAMITFYNLSKHIANHRAIPVVCHLCGVTAKNNESLRGHMYYTHSQKCLKCDLCSKTFKKLYSYKMHIKKEHTGEKSFTCDTCGKGFFTNYQLNNHIKSRHLKERKYVCQYCTKGFSSRFSMRTHERQHTNEAPYVCEVCGEGFRQNVSLRAHRKSKHNIVESKHSQCGLCSKMFRDDWALKSHVRAVHD